MNAIRQIRLQVLVILSLAMISAPLAAQTTLHATAYNSHFPTAVVDGGEAWNGMGVASDGNVYYVLSSASPDIAAQMYSFNPKTKTVTHVGDLNDAVGQGNIKAVAQGKSHVSFVESNGKLYFSTHLGYYAHVAGVEAAGAPPPGYLSYPGGHFVAYDLKTGKFEDLLKAPGGEGIITFNMDTKRERLYGITWPTGRFLTYDLKTKRFKDHGTLFHGGEVGKVGDSYRGICRRIVIDPRDGSAYFTTGDGVVHRYHYDSETIDDVTGISLKKDYFGQMDIAAPGMAYNWRAAFWDDAENVIYGINGRSGYLFRVDVNKPTVDVLDRLTSEPSKESGMYDRFNYGYMGFALGHDGHTIYYLTGSPIVGTSGNGGTGNPQRRGDGCHLITYDLKTKKYTDHGLLVLDDGSPVSAPQSIALGADGTVYTLSYVKRDGKRIIELISAKP